MSPSEEYDLLPRSEFRARHDRAKSLMAAYDLDALFITSDVNFLYYTGGSPPFSFARPYAAILPRDGNPIIVAAKAAVDTLRHESWIEDIRNAGVVWGAPVDFLRETCEALGLEGARIGAELGREQRLGLSFSDFMRLTNALPHAAFVDASRLIWDMRMVKSRNEIDTIRHACTIIGKVHDDVAGLVKPGMTEKDVLAMILQRVGELGGFAPFVFMSSGPYNRDHDFGPTNQYPRVTNRVLESGNALFLDLGCNFHGYWSDFSRVYSIGMPSHEMVKLHEFAEKLTDKCVEFVRPNIEVSQITKYCRTLSKGTAFEHQLSPDRIGHGIGLSPTEPPSIALDETIVTVPGMTFTIEPCLRSAAVTITLEHIVAVSESGCDVLTKTPTSMKIII